MKKKLFLALVALLAIGLMFMGCPAGDDDGKDNGNNPNGNTDGGEDGGEGTDPGPSGENLVTEEAILAATGFGVTTVEKVEGVGYKVTGTIAAFTTWDDETQGQKETGEYGIKLNIQADAEDDEAFFVQANYYSIKIDFPAGEITPIEDYTEGFRIYLENTKATPNTDQWAGTWQHEYSQEYEEIGGVGTMTINRNLALPAESNEVGDYQHLVIVVAFDGEDFEDKEYSFTILDVGVYGEGIDSDKGRPVIHDTSELEDAEYTVGDDDVAELKVVPAWASDSNTYTYQWYSNNTNSNENGEAIEDATVATFTPPVDTAGVTYYYCVVTNPSVDKSVATRAVKITVTDDE